MASVIADMVEWLKRWFYTEDEVDTLLSSKQAMLVSGSNIKTLNNESLLGSGNIEIESGDSGGLVNVEGYYFDEESENLVLDADDEPFITTSWGDPTSDSLTPSEKLVKNSLDAKQDTLVSGTNLKTINNESLLGSGNITIQGGSNVDVVTSWGTTLSDSKVPSEKLAKNSLDGKLDNALSSTAVTIASNDNVLITDYSDSNKVKRVSSILASQVKDSSAHSNIGSSANDTQATINTDINTALGDKVSKSQTVGLLKNDGTVDTKPYFTVTSVTPLSSDDPKKDLNDYLTQGFYAFFMNNNIPNMEQTTLPSGLDNKSFYLLVERRSDSYVKQTVTRYDNGKTWIRTKDSSTWGSWSELSVSGHTHTVSNITDFPSIPSKTSDLTNDGSDGTNVFVATNDSRLSDNRNFLVTNVTPTVETDIDSYVNNGFYTFFDNTAISTMTEENKAKLPSGLNGNSFYLLVEKRNNYVKQTLTKYNDGRTWIRIFNNNNNVQSWSAWQELSVVGHTHDDRYYTETEMDTALTGKQDTLVSGTSIKTINNESLLGSGNISISGGGGSVIGTGSFSINNNGHLIVELPNGVDNPYFINNNGHLVYDTSNTYNGE